MTGTRTNRIQRCFDGSACGPSHRGARLPHSVAAVWTMVLALSGVAAAEKIRPQTLPVTRADLAAAYMKFDASLQARPPAESEIARLNIEFDGLTGDFFSLQFGSAIEKLHRLSASLTPGVRQADEDRLRASIKARVEPRALAATASSSPFTVRLSSLYSLTGVEKKTATLRFRLVRADDASTVFESAIVCRLGEPVRHDQPLVADKGLAVGEYRVVLVGARGEPLPVANFFVTSEPIDVVRSRNEKRLAGLAGSRLELLGAVKACMARNRLLVATPSENNSAEFLANPLTLSKELAEELAALESGRNPYSGRTGDYWRTVAIGSIEIPTRVYAPAQWIGQGDSRKALPLIVALHGAGGDENMFMDAYGAGILKTLADLHGFVAVSPQTAYFTLAPGNIEALTATLAQDYPIDRRRVYVLGHSMGAGATAGVARRCVKSVAACCCLAGGGNLLADGAMAPTLVIAAEHDALIPFARMESAAKRAIDARRPVAYRPAMGYGHTLMVGAFLPQAVEWLLKKELRDMGSESTSR